MWLPASAQNSAAYAVIAGTVFREDGFALPGARVTLIRKPESASKARKAKAQEMAANFRGEFAFRVPPEDAGYMVRASAKGFVSAEKELEMRDGNRLDVTLSLAPESK